MFPFLHDKILKFFLILKCYPIRLCLRKNISMKTNILCSCAINRPSLPFFLFFFVAYQFSEAFGKLYGQSKQGVGNDGVEHSRTRGGIHENCIKYPSIPIIHTSLFLFSLFHFYFSICCCSCFYTLFKCLFFWGGIPVVLWHSGRMGAPR